MTHGFGCSLLRVLVSSGRIVPFMYREIKKTWCMRDFFSKPADAATYGSSTRNCERLSGEVRSSEATQLHKRPEGQILIKIHAFDMTSKNRRLCP